MEFKPDNHVAFTLVQTKEGARSFWIIPQLMCNRGFSFKSHLSFHVILLSNSFYLILLTYIFPCNSKESHAKVHSRYHSWLVLGMSWPMFTRKHPNSPDLSGLSQQLELQVPLRTPIKGRIKARTNYQLCEGVCWQWITALIITGLP